MNPKYEAPSPDWLHVDVVSSGDLEFNRARFRRVFRDIGQRYTQVTRQLLKRRQGSASKAGQIPAFQTGKLARSIAYRVPRASATRPGLMVKIAPGWRGEKRGRDWGKEGIPLQEKYYPIFLSYGVRRKAYGMPRKSRRQRLHHKTGDWRIAPRRNYMIDTMNGLRSWTRATLFKALTHALTTEKMHRKKE